MDTEAMYIPPMLTQPFRKRHQTRVKKQANGRSNPDSVLLKLSNNCTLKLQTILVSSHRKESTTTNRWLHNDKRTIAALHKE
jgi:hypothetical protein